MKKVVVALGVIGLFVLYSLGVRHALPGSSAAPVAATTKSTTSSNVTSNPSNASNNTANTPATGGQYKDGSYTGSSADAYYGKVQVRATISGGEITDVSFLSYPTDHQDSIMINQQAAPQLRQEAIQAQTAKVQIVSGATFTSEAFIQSLSAALDQAKA